MDKEEKRVDKLIKKLNIKLNGFYGFSEEYIQIIKEIYVGMTSIDAHIWLIIND